MAAKIIPGYVQAAVDDGDNNIEKGGKLEEALCVRVTLWQLPNAFFLFNALSNYSIF